jgi:SAM-dependent methyltransferase
MDRETIQTYDALAQDFAAEWEEAQSPPFDLQAIVRQYFKPGPTVDVGCGSGRDTAWLKDNGFDAFGVDASVGLVAEARRRHPGVRFEVDSLPKLSSLESANYTNVLCETVIMHLETELIAEAVRRLVSLLAPEGSLYLSWRVTEGGDMRDQKARLYASFPPSLVVNALGGTDIRLDEQVVSRSSQKLVHRVVARRH